MSAVSSRIVMFSN